MRFDTYPVSVKKIISLSKLDSNGYMWRVDGILKVIHGSRAIL